MRVPHTYTMALSVVWDPSIALGPKRLIYTWRQEQKKGDAYVSVVLAWIHMF